MSPAHDPKDVDSTVQQLRIVVFAMLGSLAMFASIVAFLRSETTSQIAPTFQYLFLGGVIVMAAACVGGYRLVAGQIRAQSRAAATEARSSANPLAAVLEPYRRLTIVRAGLTEGPAFMALMTYMAGGSPLALVVPAASALLLLNQLPSREAVERFAESLRE